MKCTRRSFLGGLAAAAVMPKLVVEAVTPVEVPVAAALSPVVHADERWDGEGLFGHEVDETPFFEAEGDLTPRVDSDYKLFEREPLLEILKRAPKAEARGVHPWE